MLTYCPSCSRQQYGALYWTIPLLDKQRKCYEWLSAFQFVYDSVCLHSALLNWLRNRLEMVLLLYTSHNSPSHQCRAIFYLGDDVSIRVCQPLTAALWVVVLGESIVNQHNNNRISLAVAYTSSVVERQFIRWLLIQNTHRSRHIDSRSISIALFYSPSHSFTRKKKEKRIKDLRKSDNWDAEKRQDLTIGSVPVSSSSTVSVFHQKVWGTHKVQIPIWQHFSPHTQNRGSFKDWSLVAPSAARYCLH